MYTLYIYGVDEVAEQSLREALVTQEQPTRGAGLTREKVLAAALELADAEGLETLSFRRLATVFGVTPMALYRYVAGKEELLVGVGDLVLSQLELPQAPEDEWRDQLRAVARSFRTCLTSHPSAIPIFLGRALFTPAATRTADAILGSLRRAGFPPEQAVLLYQQVARFVLALVMLETGARPDASEDERRERMQMARITFETLPPGEYPHLVEAAPFLTSSYDADEAFESGLDLLIAGLDRLRPQSGDAV